MMSTSAIRGTLVRTWRPSARRQAAMSLSTEFLAPPARTGPSRGPLATTRTSSATVPVHPLQYGRGGRGAPGTDPGSDGRRPAIVAAWPSLRHPTETWRWSSSGSPRPPPWPPPGGWGGATRRGPTAPPSTPCASSSRAWPWTAWWSSARARRTTPRCSTTASTSATARRRRPTSPWTPSTGRPRPPWAGAARWPSSPCPRRAPCSTPARACTWRSWRWAPGPGRHRHHRARRGQPGQRGQGQGRPRCGT